MFGAPLRWMRWFALAFLGLACIASAALLLLLFVPALMEKERPEILRDLPRETQKIAPAFSGRLTMQFPVGTDEERLKTRLFDWGFDLDEDDVGQYARYRTEPVVCQETYFVYWTLDEKRQLTHIEGDVHISCL